MSVLTTTTTGNATPIVPDGTWTIDPAHSTLEFAIRHLGVATVKGRASELAGTITGGEQARIEGAVPVAGLTTFDETRDGHLQSPDFFDADRFPELRFVATSIAAQADDGVVVQGDLTTFDETRDGHLQSPDFFDADRFPELRFVATSIAQADDGVVVQGDLTMKGVTKPVTLNGNLYGPATDPWGNERIGLDLEGTVDRNDFGISWNAPLPAGGYLLPETVRLSASFSAVKAV